MSRPLTRPGHTADKADHCHIVCASHLGRFWYAGTRQALDRQAQGRQAGRPEQRPSFLTATAPPTKIGRGADNWLSHSDWLVLPPPCLPANKLLTWRLPAYPTIHNWFPHLPATYSNVSIGARNQYPHAFGLSDLGDFIWLGALCISVFPESSNVCNFC